MVLAHLEIAGPWQQVSTRWVFSIGVFPSAKVQTYALIALRDCSALLESPVKVGGTGLVEGTGVFLAEVVLAGFVTDTSISSFSVSKRLVRMRAKLLLVYWFLESGMQLAPVVGFFFLITTAV